MPRKRSKKKKKTAEKIRRNIFSPLDNDGPYQNSPRSSPFLRLPGEVRNEIYLALFSSTRISFGEEETKGKTKLRVLPARHSLSLLHTCRQIHIEANPLWAGLILIHFGSITAMANKIKSIPEATIKDIRQMRVLWTSQSRYQWYDWDSWPLKTLYKLCLDRFTVLFNQLAHGDTGFMRVLLELTTCGRGWKELHCITKSCSILSEIRKSPYSSTYISRDLQSKGIDEKRLRSMGIFTIEDWLKWEFMKRDGPSSDASIKICRPTTCAHNGIRSMMDSASYVEVDKKKPLTPTQLKKSCKQALLVAKRASNADFMSPVPPGQGQSPVYTWNEVWKRLSQSRPLYTGDAYDSYESPLDYSWRSWRKRHQPKKKPSVHMHKLPRPASSIRRKVSFDLDNLTDDSDIEDYRDRNKPDWTIRGAISTLPPRKRRNYVVLTILIFVFLYWASHRPQPPKGLSPYLNYDAIDWSRYAYTQYVTNDEYLCNSVMVFEALHRLGSRADKILFYPQEWDTVISGPNDRTSQLLLEARNKYNVQLEPIEINTLQDMPGDASTWDSSITKLWAFRETTYRRILQIDSDVMVLQNLDELFFLPSAPVAMPRAYWDSSNGHKLTSLLVLLEPSYVEYRSMMDRVEAVTAGQLGKDEYDGHPLYDMELLNDRYAGSALVLPHRQYGLVTGEFRKKDHRDFLGNDHETWNPDTVLKQAKLVHFSDWPLPKPWVMWPQKLLAEVIPRCDNKPGTPQESGCHDREVWKQLYEDFRLTRKNVCMLLSYPAPEWPPKEKNTSNQPPAPKDAKPVVEKSEEAQVSE